MVNVLYVNREGLEKIISYEMVYVINVIREGFDKLFSYELHNVLYVNREGLHEKWLMYCMLKWKAL